MAAPTSTEAVVIKGNGKFNGKYIYIYIYTYNRTLGRSLIGQAHKDLIKSKITRSDGHRKVNMRDYYYTGK